MTPAWHDVPTVPGDYQLIWTDTGARGVVRIENPEKWDSRDLLRYYGPLPDPPPIPEPPKPPRLFRCKVRGSGNQARIGLLIDGIVHIFGANGYIAAANIGENELDGSYTDIVFDDGAPA